jgi:hypothetical protein
MKKTFYTILITLIFLNFSCTNNIKFGKVAKIKGDVSIFFTKENKWTPAKKNVSIYFGDTLQTKEGSVEIVFKNKSKITLEPNSKVLIIDSTDENKKFIFPIVFTGGILSEVKHRKSNDFTYIVYTPVAYAEARGTYYYVSYSPTTGSTDVHAFDGNIVVYNVSNFSEPVQVLPGYSTTITYSNAPQKPSKLKYNQFRRVGYMFSPDICEKYEIAFGFPVVPIPVPVPVFVPVSVPTPSHPISVQESEPISQEDNYYDDDNNNYAEEYDEPVRPPHRHRPKSNVSVSVSVNAPIPLPVPIPLPGMLPAPVPFPAPRPGYHAHHAPVPVGAPPIIAPVPGIPVPGPGRSHHRSYDREERHVSGHPPVPPAPIPPVPGGRHFPFGR